MLRPQSVNGAGCCFLYNGSFKNLNVKSLEAECAELDDLKVKKVQITKELLLPKPCESRCGFGQGLAVFDRSGCHASELKYMTSEDLCSWITEHCIPPIKGTLTLITPSPQYFVLSNSTVVQDRSIVTIRFFGSVINSPVPEGAHILANAINDVGASPATFVGAGYIRSNSAVTYPINVTVSNTNQLSLQLSEPITDEGSFYGTIVYNTQNFQVNYP